jgi:DNA-binding GntR family transcriptional regulator
MLECNITYQIKAGAPSRGSSPQGKGHEMAMVPSAVGGGSIRTNLKDVVADHIRNLIFSGQLRPGQKVDQDEIAEVLGVSKLPVREALILLENEALVRGVPRRGVFVAPLTPDDVFDHYEIYGMVEGIAARRAAQNLSDAELEKLAEITSQMHKDDLPERQEKLNYEFHRAINIAGGTPKLLTVLHVLSKTMPARFFEIAGGWADIAGDQHRQIEAALRVRDGAAAEQAMYEHILSGGEYAVEILRESGFWDNKAE